MPVLGGYCKECNWSADASERRMDIDVHRAKRTFFAHTTVLLNVPQRELDSFFGLPDWQAVVAGKYLALPEARDRRLADWATSMAQRADDGLSGSELDELLRRQVAGELSPEQLVHEMNALRERKRVQAGPASGVKDALVARSGVPWSVWEAAGQELFETIMPFEVGRPVDLLVGGGHDPIAQTARQMGFSRLAVINDFPILSATYGFSRVEYAPQSCQLNAFPAEREYDGRYPIYVDQVQADALLFTLDAARVLRWLGVLGFPPVLPGGTDSTVVDRAFFVRLFEDASLHITLDQNQPQVRLVFGLLHTLSHLAVRQASLLCGLDATSLSEYLLPRSLTAALYCNHRFGAAIGALSALFEQSLSEWIGGIRKARHCVYDPVCRERESSCHACTHLAETSCRHFNLNLSRALVFGGHDPFLGPIAVGYLDPQLN
jgi:hypothetical protein